MSAATARVILQRQPKPRQDVLTTYQVLIDGNVVGGIRRKQTKSFDVEAGRHEIRLKWKKYTSKLLFLDLAPGQQVRLVCRPRPASEWPRKTPSMYMVLDFEGLDRGTAA
jgi:hypothetical protein